MQFQGYSAPIYSVNCDPGLFPTNFDLEPKSLPQTHVPAIMMPQLQRRLQSMALDETAVSCLREESPVFNKQ